MPTASTAMASRAHALTRSRVPTRQSSEFERLHSTRARLLGKQIGERCKDVIAVKPKLGHFEAIAVPNWDGLKGNQHGGAARRTDRHWREAPNGSLIPRFGRR